MSRQPKLTNFVSEMDQFLQAFDQQHPQPTQSQQKEQTKYHRIHTLRDNDALPVPPSSTLWKGF